MKRGSYYRTTRRQIQDDKNLRIHRHQILKSHFLLRLQEIAQRQVTIALES